MIGELKFNRERNSYGLYACGRFFNKYFRPGDLLEVNLPNAGGWFICSVDYDDGFTLRTSDCRALPKQAYDGLVIRVDARTLWQNSK